MFYNEIKSYVEILLIFVSDKNYKICLLHKAADIIIKDIDRLFTRKHYRNHSILFKTLNQLKTILEVVYNSLFDV